MEEGQEEEKTSEEDMNWEDFMNVVTTYSCKFCTFTCTAPSEMGKHVKRTHMAKKVMPPSQTDAREGLSSIESGLIMNNDSVAESVSPTTEESVPQPSGDVTGFRAAPDVSAAVVNGSSVAELTSIEGLEDKGTEVGIGLVGAENAAVIDTEGTLVTSSIRAAEEEGHYIIVQEGSGQTMALSNILDTVPSKPQLVDSATDTADPASATPTTSSSQLGVNVANSTLTSLDLSGPLYNPNLGQYSVIAEIPVTSGAPVNPPVTKELFLCGQCSNGFASIEDCREHMITAHSSLLIAGNDGEMEGTNQVSVGTQMAQKKKPGRKKKSAMQPVGPKPKDPDEDDDDWEPGYDISGGRESRKKRKIRPPRALKEDYYLGRRKKKKKERKTYYTDAYTLKCKLFGCHAKFKEQKALDMHIKCHNDEDYNFSCIQCQEQFDLWKNLRIHLWKKHEIDCDMFECESCGTKTDTYHKLTVHKEIHSENRPYTCDICGKGFKQFSQMRNHQVIHTEHRVEKPERWYSNKECDICKRVFANRKCLKKHVQAVHTKEKPFVCPYCGHAASRKAMLELHIRTHTGEKPFKCDVCPYATGDHNSLRRHKMRHTGQKQYKCQYCPYSCIQAISLKTHMKNKHPGLEGIYACDACIFRTVNKHSYQQHMLDHKNGLVADVRPKAGNRVSGDTQTVIISQGTHTCSPDATAVEMQVQTMASGEAQISAEDLAKLSNCEGLVPGDVSAASLIYQALSVISQTPEHTQGNATQSAHILGGVQTLIKSSATAEGVTTHNIIFHLPNSATAQEAAVPGEESTEAEQVYFEQPVEVIEALHRANNQQAELMDGTQGNLPTVITMEASEAELEGMNLNLVPVSTSDGTIIIQQPASMES